MDTLRPLLQPITHNLPQPIQNLAISIIGEPCYTTLIHDLDLTSATCLKLALSKGLGIGIIGASSIVKIPQILKLINAKSASGISFLSYLLETSAYLIGLAYNVRQGFPFSTYGETGLIMVQNVVIAVLVLNYSGKATGGAVFVAGLAAAAFALFSPNVIDMPTLGYFQAGAGVLGVASKLPQILAVWKEGGTGQLSAFAVSTFRVYWLNVILICACRSSTTSSDRFLAFLQLYRRSTINSSSTVSSQDSS
jgi:mannose-P-dolichol utilization defect protein 1